MSDIFSIMLGNLTRLGFFQYLLPFLLILAIVYAVIKMTMGDKIDKSAAGLIALIIAFFFMNYSGMVGIQLSQFMTTFFGGASIVLTGILVVLIFLGLVGIKLSSLLEVKEGKLTGPAAVFLILLIFIGFLIFLGAGGAFLVPIQSNWLGVAGQDLAAMIFFIVILALALWWLSREKETKGETK